MTTLADEISHLSPCLPAVEWLSGYQSNQEKLAWQECKRGDWMVWMIGKKVTSPPWSEERKPFFECTLACSSFAREYWPESVKAAILILQDWVHGEATTEEAQKARKIIASASAYANYASVYAYTANAVYTATHAAAGAGSADAYTGAAGAFAAVAYAAAGTAYAAATANGTKANDTAVYAATAARNLDDCAGIVRSYYPSPP